MLGYFNSIAKTKKSIGLLALALALNVGAPASAAQLSFDFSDPVSDGAPIDLTSLNITFDNQSGDYELTWRATALNPFTGDFRLNANLYNPDAEARSPSSAFFNDTFNEFSLGASTQTEFVLTGTSSVLLDWSAGDRVAVSGPDPLGVPAGVTSFRTEVRFITGSDPLIDSFDPSSVTIPAPVPLPASLPLLAVAALGLGALASRRHTGKLDAEQHA